MTEPPNPEGRALSTETVQRLSGRMVGKALVEGDAGYDEARRVFNAMIDRRPEVILPCVDASDVAQGIDLARSHALALSVEGGGHSVAGHVRQPMHRGIGLLRSGSVRYVPEA